MILSSMSCKALNLTDYLRVRDNHEKIAIILIIYAFWISRAIGDEPHTINRSDCYASFSMPIGTKYIGIEGLSSFLDFCNIAFDYTGELKTAHTKPVDDTNIRALVDELLDVTKIPLNKQMEKIEFDNKNNYKLMSKERINLIHGDGYILHYMAVKSDIFLMKNNELRQTVFVIGDDTRSIVRYFYFNDHPGWMDKRKMKIYKELFSSFNFYPTNRDAL